MIFVSVWFFFIDCNDKILLIYLFKLVMLVIPTSGVNSANGLSTVICMRTCSTLRKKEFSQFFHNKMNVFGFFFILKANPNTDGIKPN